MERLTEQVAGELGKKWTQLCSLLGLGHSDRHRFGSAHKTQPEQIKYKKCATDTINKWREGVKKLPEKEVMTKLLAALGKVHGFQERARQLANNFGIDLDPPSSASPTSTSSSESTGTCVSSTPTCVTTCVTYSTPHMVTHSHSSTHPHMVTHSHNSTHPHMVIQGTPHGNQMESRSDERKELNFTGSRPVAQFSQAQQEPTLLPQESSQNVLHHSLPENHFLRQNIDISTRRHKFALLDISQRLPENSLFLFAQHLCIPVETVREVCIKHSDVEERYYQMLKLWVCGSEGQATFADLHRVLEACQHQTVCSVMMRRLNSTGLTLWNS